MLTEKLILTISDYLFLPNKIGPADLIFVFGTRHPDPVFKAWEAYRQDYANKIFISGGVNRLTKINEAETLGMALNEQGVLLNDIILENQSTNTLENVLFSKKIIATKIGFENIKNIIVVTKNYHMRRALMTLKKHFPGNINFLPYAYELNGINKENWFRDNESSINFLSEYNKIKKYFRKRRYYRIR